MQRYLNQPYYLAALLSLGVLACGQKQQATKLPAANEAIAVRLVPVEQGGIAGAIETTGLLFTEDESRLSFKTGGVIESVLVSENDFVKPGQVLATLRNTEIAARVAQVQLNVEKAERDYERTYNLYKDSVATLEQLQNAKTGLEIARKELTTVNFNQQYTRIYAPSSGFVVKKLMEAGEIAGAGMPVVVLNHVSAGSHWCLRTGVSDAQWAALEIGNKAMVELTAFPGKMFEAKVSQKSLTADPASGSFSVELRVSLQGSKPAVGMFGRAKIETGKTTYASVIPYTALLEADGNRGYVFVSNDSTTVEKREVVLGKMYNDKIEVLQGLENVQKIVVAGSAFLSEKSTIQIIQ